MANQIGKIDKKLQALIESCEDYKAKNEIIACVREMIVILNSMVRDGAM